MDDQEALSVVNHDITADKLKSLLQQGNTTSFIFSIKNRVGGLARALKVFQVSAVCSSEMYSIDGPFSKENGINVVHIESRRSRRANSEYEIYVDLEADRSRVSESMQQLKRQVSCVRFDLTNLADLTESLDGKNNEVGPASDGFEEIDLPPPSPFLDKNGHPINRKSKSNAIERERRKNANKWALNRKKHASAG